MLGVRWERGRLLGRGAHGTVYFARLHDDDATAPATAAAAAPAGVSSSCRRAKYTVP